MNLPNDPMILLSFVNTQLRDFYKDLDSFCEAAECSCEFICDKLKAIDYEYDPTANRFV